MNSMESFYLLFDLFIAGAGIYGIKDWLEMKKSGQLKACKLIMPADCKLADCKDPEGFYAYIMPRLLWFSVVCVICGVFSGLNDYFKFLGSLGTAVTCLCFVIPVVIYSVTIRRSYTRFFR
ncbi:MAG: hypothetical protein IJP11_07435 [Oscillospiraceae bacterium]|nr:hypothetical protein [Oscillospiraceae bacterium]